MSPRKSIYLDFAATTPVLPQVRAAIAEALDGAGHGGAGGWANPSSQHAGGRAARAALEEARGRVAAALGWGGEVIFTSGATEALAIGWGRARVRRKIVSAVEHPALLRLAGANRLPVDGAGLVSADSLPDAELIAVQQVNNETGVIQPLGAIAEAVHARGGVLLADCAQGAGKLPLPDADMIAIAGHKLGAPAGIGALLVRDFGLLEASGGQERGYRPGTENLPYIIGLATALEMAVAEQAWLVGAAELRGYLEAEIRALGAEVIAADAPRLPTIGAYRLPGVHASLALIRCDSAGIAISAGSACSSGSMKPSDTLLAMGMSEATAREVFRVSIGRQTTRDDIDALLVVMREIARGCGRGQGGQ